ncbi:MAG: dTDP-4-dehydro-6-deoxyglucose aminotransferase, partial [Fuerstiella sp.]|nr:dTDP-4-dehydro-6-deoxyglucose aminotransferase [Fuerstiella sp.]
QQFAQELKAATGSSHAVCVCNGTMALQLLAKASGLTGEVIVPSMTFIATAHALEWIGLKPVFADVDIDTHTLDPASVERCVTASTSAIFGVHLWGNPCDVEGLQRIAKRHNLKLLFDASHAFGCVHDSVPVGGLGDGETFSFHATKTVHSIEGGAVVTNSDDIAERCRLMHNFGITGMTRIESPGINAKMSELSAAVGLTSLKSFDAIMSHNQLRMNDYRSVLQDVPGIDLVIP